MKHRLLQFWTATAKELTVCYRDPDVFIYSIVLPALIYPVMLFCTSEFLLWRTGATAQLKVKAAIVDDGSADVSKLEERLEKEALIAVVESKNPRSGLNDGSVDVVIEHAADKFTLSLKDSSANSDNTRDKLGEFFRAWQTDELKHTLKASGKNVDYLRVFKVDLKDSAPSVVIGPGKDEKSTPLGGIRMIFCTMLCLACSSIAYGAMAPSVCLFTEEREKSTLPTTVLIPVNRILIILAKLTATLFVSLIAGFANLLNLLLVGLVVLVQTKMTGTLNVSAIFNETVPLPVLAAIFALLVGLAATVSAVFSATATTAKDYSQSYNLLALPLLWCTVLSLFGALPVVRHLEFTTWLPVVNLVYQVSDVLNRDVNMRSLCIVLVENLLIGLLCVWFIRNLLLSERILSGPAR